GENGGGCSTMACMVARSGVDLLRNVCHSSSCAILPRAAARSFRSRYTQMCTTSFSWETSVCHTPTRRVNFSRKGRISLNRPSHSPSLPTCARYQRSSYTLPVSDGGGLGRTPRRTFVCGHSTRV